MKTIDLFSGLGGNALAFESFARSQLYCEIDPAPLAILRAVMARGLITTAPVHGDVRTLLASPEYAAARAAGIDMVAGSWPCTGNSSMGKRKGMEDPQSGLLRELCAVIKDCGAPLFFAENVPSVLGNGSLVHLFRELGDEFDIAYCLACASDYGYPHRRQRFFVFGMKRGHIAGEQVLRKALSIATPPATKYVEHTERMVITQDVNCRARLGALGNAVVPRVSYEAFMTLANTLLGASELGGPETIPGVLPKAGALTSSGFVALDLARPEDANQGLVLDPSTFTLPEGKKPSALLNKELILLKPRHVTGWATPRKSNWQASNFLTRRTAQDLPTQIRFERNTPDALRRGYTCVGFVEAMMGFPVGYTAPE